MGSQKGFTIATESTIKVVGVVIIGALFFATASNELIPLIDTLAESLGINPYEEAALNSAEAFSYAVSCTALVQSYADCGGPNANDKCSDIHSEWQSAASEDISKSCSAAGGGTAKFGNIEVTCDELGAGDSGGCEVQNFNLPQNFQEGDGSIADKAATFILGRGHPKYLLYYEAFDASEASDWQARLAGTDLAWRAAQIVGMATLSGLLYGIPTFGAAAGPASSKLDLIKRAIPDNFGTWTRDKVQDFIDAASGSSILGRVPGTDPLVDTMRRAEEYIVPWIRNRLNPQTGLTGIFYSAPGIIKGKVASTTAEALDVTEAISFNTAILDHVARRTGSDFPDNTRIVDQGGRLLYYGSDDVDGIAQRVDIQTYINDDNTIATSELTDRIRFIMDDQNLVDDLPASDFSNFRSYWNNLDDAAKDDLARELGESWANTRRGTNYIDDAIERGDIDVGRHFMYI